MVVCYLTWVFNPGKFTQVDEFTRVNYTIYTGKFTWVNQTGYFKKPTLDNALLNRLPFIPDAMNE